VEKIRGKEIFMVGHVEAKTAEGNVRWVVSLGEVGKGKKDASR